MLSIGLLRLLLNAQWGRKLGVSRRGAIPGEPTNEDQPSLHDCSEAKGRVPCRNVKWLSSVAFVLQLAVTVAA
ncbi:hypothetical protein D3C86_2118130 [compost metagenome]